MGGGATMLNLDRKRYGIALYYNYNQQYADIIMPDISDLVRDLSWSVYRNAALGVGQIMFVCNLSALIARYREKVDQLSLTPVLKEQAMRDVTKWLTTPSTKTICAVNVQNEPGATVVPVARGYLAQAPVLQPNGDTYDVAYTFTGFDGYLTMLPPAYVSSSSPDSTTEWTGDYNSNQETVAGSFDTLARRIYQSFAFAYPFAQFGSPFVGFKSDSGTYARASYTPGTFVDTSDQLKQIIETSNNDLWVDNDRNIHISPHRGASVKKYIRYPGRLDSTQADEMQCFTPPTYTQQYDPATVVYALSKTTSSNSESGGVVTTTNRRKAYANAASRDIINAAGLFISTLDNAQDGEENLAAVAYLRAHAAAEPVPSIMLDGTQVDWASLSVGDDVHVFNTALPSTMPQYEGDFRISSIQVNTDANRHETIQLDLEDPTVGKYSAATASGTIRALKQFLRYIKR